MLPPARPGGAPRALEALSLPLLIVLWQALALVLDHRLFPTPIAVATEIARLAIDGVLLSDLGRTLLRAGLAFVAAMAIGTAIGAVLGRRPRLDALFGSWVLVGLNMPAIVVAILCYIWLGLTEFALILAVTINKAPLVAVTLREGIRNLDPGTAELARVYRVPRLRRLRRFVLPQLMPFMLAAARTGLSLIWKIVLVFEVLGSDGGVGFRIGIFFQNFDITGILSYTTAFMAIIFALEYLVLRPVERKVLGWRRT